MDNVYGIDLGRGRGRGRGVIPMMQERRELRRPHTLPHEMGLPPQNMGGPVPITLISHPTADGNSMLLYNQTLNENGAMFYPSDQLTNQMATMCLATGTSKLSADAPEFIPSSHQATERANPAPELPQRFSAPQLQYLNHPVVLQVNNIVVNLTLKPHRFSQIASQMNSLLSTQVKEENLMKEIVSVIFEQGVGEPNFRYSGALLCQYLSKNVNHCYDGLMFRQLLFLKFQEEHEDREFYLRNEVERLCGLTMFLSDVYSHVLTPDGCPFEQLQNGICKLLITLMNNPTSSNLKCVAQVLKGSGHKLDKGNEEEMEKVMRRLKDVAMTAEPESIRTMLIAIVELRASNWGRSQESVKNTNDQEALMGTVYYGPGGVIQRIENVNDDSGSDTDDSYFGIPNEDDELEGEVAKAFEEFLKGQ